MERGGPLAGGSVPCAPTTATPRGSQPDSTEPATTPLGIITVTVSPPRLIAMEDPKARAAVARSSADAAPGASPSVGGGAEEEAAAAAAARDCVSVLRRFFAFVTAPIPVAVCIAACARARSASASNAAVLPACISFLVRSSSASPP